MLAFGAGAEGSPSVGVAGPSQVFSAPTGQNISSYIRIYNGGNSTGNYSIVIEGNVTAIALLEARSLVIPPGENRRVSIIYVAPNREAYYEGLMVVSLTGEQIVPGVTREIRITLKRPPQNRPPRVRIVFPKEGEVLKGNVQVAAEAEDPDGDPVSIEIYIDGGLVATGETYVWHTRKWPNGGHELRVVASDSNLTGEANRTLRVENPKRQGGWVLSLVLVAVVASGLALFILRERRSRKA